jgi:hypothetical protein
MSNGMRMSREPHLVTVHLLTLHSPAAAATTVAAAAAAATHSLLPFGLLQGIQNIPISEPEVADKTRT